MWRKNTACVQYGSLGQQPGVEESRTDTFAESYVQDATCDLSVRRYPAKIRNPLIPDGGQPEELWLSKWLIDSI